MAFDLCLSVALSFEAALRTRQMLREKEPEVTNSVSLGRLCWDSKKRSLKLVEFDLESAIASLKFDQPVIPICLDRIHGTIANKLGN